MVRYQQPEPPRRSTGRRSSSARLRLARARGSRDRSPAPPEAPTSTSTRPSTTSSATPGQIKHIGKRKSCRRFRPRPNRRSLSSPVTTSAERPRGTNPYAGSNSDTLMLLRADPTNDTLSLLSFPRDLYVPIYCSGNTATTTFRINSAWSTCSNGPAGTLDTVEKLTGLHINYLITLDFHAFTQIVDHLHGVYMNVDRRYFIGKGTGTSAINLHPGYQKLDGAQALSYVRYRHTDSDIYRNGRQQLFLDALKSRVKTISIFDALKVIGDLKHNVEIGKGGGGNVTPDELKSYLGLLYGLPAGHLFRNAIPLNAFKYFVTPAAPTWSPRRRARSTGRSRASSIRTSARRRRSTPSSAASRRPRRRRRRSSTSCRSRRSRCSSSTPAGSRARPRTPGTGSRCTATRRRRSPRATRPTHRGWPATRPSTTTPCRRTGSRPRSSFGRSSAHTRASSR